jgi:hypothetical protein
MAIAEFIPGSRLSAPAGAVIKAPESSTAPIIEACTPNLPITDVIYVGRSAKRRIAIRNVMMVDSPNARLRSTPGGPEYQDSEQSDIVRDKLRFGLDKAMKKVPELAWSQTLLIAADTRNLTYVVGPDGKGKLNDRSKPQTPGEIIEVFRELRGGATATADGNPTYLIQSTSIATTMDLAVSMEGIDIATPHQTWAVIELDLDMLRILETPRGSREYLDRVNAYLASKTYLRAGLKHPLTSTAISGSLEVAVLGNMGVIKKAMDIPYGDVGFGQAMRDTMHTVHVGISAETVEDFFPNAARSFNRFKWTKAQAAFAAGQRTT